MLFSYPKSCLNMVPMVKVKKVFSFGVSLESICWDCTVLLTFLSVVCISLALFPAHSQPVICAIYFCLVSIPVNFMTAGIAALNNILSCTYPAYPLPGNISCHYTFENWSVLGMTFSALVLLHASFDFMEPFANNVHFSHLQKKSWEAFCPWPTNNRALRSTWQWLLHCLF